jgi:hypothetical protein
LVYLWAPEGNACLDTTTGGSRCSIGASGGSHSQMANNTTHNIDSSFNDGSLAQIVGPNLRFDFYYVPLGADIWPHHHCEPLVVGCYFP